VINPVVYLTGGNYVDTSEQINATYTFRGNIAPSSRQNNQINKSKRGKNEEGREILV
jgi:hypothetical protein